MRIKSKPNFCTGYYEHSEKENCRAHELFVNTECQHYNLLQMFQKILPQKVT